MARERFRALIVQEGAPGADLREIGIADLPAGEVLIEVGYSSINYKDALSVTGKGKIARRFPMAPGIDLSGVVLESSDPAIQVGDSVLVTGCGLGETIWGGFSELARVPAECIVPMPKGLDARKAMALGTAGFTAMLCLQVLEHHGVHPGSGDVVITGAGGGVGSLSVALLANLGYRVTAATGKQALHERMRDLGAQSVVDSKEIAGQPKPLVSARWVGAIDTVGQPTLPSILSSMVYRGCVAACGNAGGMELHTTVFPFILRSVALVGVSSSQCPRNERLAAWQRLAKEFPLEKLDSIVDTVKLQDVPAVCEQMIAATTSGRIVVDLTA
jgi:acrylyl-CoA reductase (NADPH)